jgi:branched-subunit amino acid permease
MYQRTLTYLMQWNKDTDERVKLQYAYAFGGVTLLVVAGLIGLFNYDLGQFLLPIALIAIAIFFINAIVWALLKAFVLLRLERPVPRGRAKRR